MPNPSPKIDHMPPPNPAAIEAECAPQNRVTPYAASVRDLLLDAAKKHLTQAPDQQPVPDFGEPWIFESGDIFTSKDYLVCDVYSGDGSIDECDKRGKRIVATMNACASMRDPAAEIQALRDAASCLALLVDHGHADDCLLLNRANAPCDCGVDRAEATLAKLKALA